jgi:uncharacterized protein (TIGR03435 family)
VTIHRIIRAAFVAGLWGALFLAAGLDQAVAQNPSPADAEPRFEVASIRPQTSAPSGFLFGIRTLPNGIDAGLATIRMLIMAAYQVADYQVVGGPALMNSDRYQISARAAGDVTPAMARRMLKNLLQDRFALKARTETREMDVHALVLARSDGQLGPRLRRTSPECAEAALAARTRTLEESKKPAALPPGCARESMGSDRAGGAIYSFGAVALDRLVTRISFVIGGRPVVDRTGLTGLFDIQLEFASETRQLQPRPVFTKDSGLPTLRDALQDQLGLKLETGKGPIEVVVIESVERPSEN